MWYGSKTATAGPDRPVRLFSNPSSRIRARAAAGLLLGALVAGIAGCATTPPPKTKPEPAKPEKAAEPAPPAPTPTPTPAPAQPPKKPYEGREHIIEVLDSGNETATSSRTLVEAARAERERRAHAGPPVAVINDKNLKKQATGQLTYATPQKVEKGSEPAVSDEPVRDEQYWRSRALKIRIRWRHAADDVKELEKTAAGWRRRFYAERDTHVRDGQIKPEWDRVLDRLEEARSEVVASTRELEEFMEEGRKAGALPGWLREGVDQEPKEEPKPSNQHEVIEPPKADGNGS